MKLFYASVLVGIFIFLSSTTYAQFQVDGAFQTRFSMLHGQRKPVAKGTEAIFGADQRSQLILSYKTKKYETRFTIQDARVWGSDDYYNATGPQRNSYALGIQEAWFEFKMNEFSRFRIGRQEWSYNASRLLSPRRWWTARLAYDALLYKYHNNNSGWFFDLGISYNNNMTQGTGGYVNSYPNRLKTVNFLNLQKKFSEKFNLTLNVVLSGQQDALNENTLYMKSTQGIIVNYNFGKKKESGLFGTLQAYYQTGTQAMKLGGHSEASGYMFDVQLGYLTPKKKFSVAVGLEMLSGHDQTKTDSSYIKATHTFDLLQGGRHPYYGGQLDYFVMPAETENGGLIDPYLRMSYKINKANIIKLDVFLPMLATSVKTGRKDASGADILYESSLGIGVDLSYIRVLSKDIKLKITGSFFNMSDSYKDMRKFLTYDANNNITDDNAGVQYMIYSTLSITPSFFNSANFNSSKK